MQRIIKNDLIWPFTKREIKRLKVKIDKSPGHGPKGDCWIWLGHLDQYGYGQMKIAYQTHSAHRVVYVYFKKKTLKRKWILRHKCDTPSCVRPRHVLKGTQKQNIADKYKRGRANHLCGEACSYAKLTEKDVRKIRKLYKFGVRGCGLIALGKLFNVHMKTIQHVVMRGTWKHVK